MTAQVELSTENNHLEGANLLHHPASSTPSALEDDAFVPSGIHCVVDPLHEPGLMADALGLVDADIWIEDYDTLFIMGVWFCCLVLTLLSPVMIVFNEGVLLWAWWATLAGGAGAFFLLKMTNPSIDHRHYHTALSAALVVFPLALEPQTYSTLDVTIASVVVVVILSFLTFMSRPREGVQHVGHPQLCAFTLIGVSQALFDVIALTNLTSYLQRGAILYIFTGEQPLHAATCSHVDM